MRTLTLWSIWMACGAQPDPESERRWSQVEAASGLSACGTEPAALTAALQQEPLQPESVLQQLWAWHEADPAAITAQTDFWRWLTPWTGEVPRDVTPQEVPLVMHIAAVTARCGGMVPWMTARRTILMACQADLAATRAASRAMGPRLAEALDLPGVAARESVWVWQTSAPLEERFGGPAMRRSLRQYLETWALGDPREVPPERERNPAIHVVYQGALGLHRDAVVEVQALERCLGEPEDGPVADPDAVGLLLAAAEPGVGLLRVPAVRLWGLEGREPVGELGTWWVVDAQGPLGQVRADQAQLLPPCAGDPTAWVEARVALDGLTRQPAPETASGVLALAVPYPAQPRAVPGAGRLAVELLGGAGRQAAVELEAAPCATLRVEGDRYPLSCCR